MSFHKKDFDETKHMSFLRKDDELLEKYNKIWEKVKTTIKTEFDSEPGYNEKHLIAKIKPYDGKINTNFQYKVLYLTQINWKLLSSSVFKRM